MGEVSHIYGRGLFRRLFLFKAIQGFGSEISRFFMAGSRAKRRFRSNPEPNDFSLKKGRVHGSQEGFSNNNGETQTSSTENAQSYLSDTRFDQCPVSSSSLEGIKAAGYERMTVVQEATLPVILKGKDVLAKAKTGTGKTIAFLMVFSP